MSSTLSVPVKHVSDTAFLVAAYRGMASKKPGALFQDDLADVLVGDLGPKLLGQVPIVAFGEWLMVVRTAALDKLILDAVASGVETIVNLATGLDTRPYRLPLPPSVTWVEMDLAGIIDYKNETLATYTPRCRLERLVVDLSIDADRTAALKQVDAKAKRSLVLTEGLLIYLTEPNVAQLAKDLHAMTSLESWLIDLTGPKFMNWAHQAWKQDTVSEDKVDFKFFVADAPKFFGGLGWTVGSFETFSSASTTLGRSPHIVNGQSAPDDSGILLLKKDPGSLT